jgi:hypothetical protein
MRTNILPIVLPKPLYKELERRAYAQERDPLQHARWLLKQALSDADDRSAILTTVSPGPEAA